jgi:hypothetical protein
LSSPKKEPHPISSDAGGGDLFPVFVFVDDETIANHNIGGRKPKGGIDFVAAFYLVDPTGRHYQYVTIIGDSVEDIVGTASVRRGNGK